jgi:polyisoprenoid-binding protein YceI
MRKGILGLVCVGAVVVLAGAAPVRAADDFGVDAMHAGVNFKISHLGLSWVYGRFNDLSGSFTIDADDPAKCSFELKAKAESVDTGNNKRDDHLRSPDFFNVKQYPGVSFKSTSVKAIKDGYEVKGDLTLHGQSKEVTLNLTGGRTAEFPKGVKRTGYSGELTIKRSEYGMDKLTEAIGDEVHITLSFEGTKK